MLINQQNLQGIYTGFKTIFNKRYAEVTPQYTRVAMTVPSSARSENYAWLGQMPTLREWIGEREVANLTANTYTIINKSYELTIGIPRDDIMDDNIGIYNPLVSNMGEEARLHPDTLVFSLLEKGFTEKCYDGKPFFSEVHPLEPNKTDAEIQSNYGTFKLRDRKSVV